MNVNSLNSDISVGDFGMGKGSALFTAETTERSKALLPLGFITRTSDTEPLSFSRTRTVAWRSLPAAPGGRNQLFCTLRLIAAVTLSRSLPSRSAAHWACRSASRAF